MRLALTFVHQNIHRPRCALQIITGIHESNSDVKLHHTARSECINSTLTPVSGELLPNVTENK